MKFFVLFSESKTYKRGKEVASKLETSIQNVVEGSYHKCSCDKDKRRRYSDSRGPI